jgi:uncharacterized membrane protein
MAAAAHAEPGAPEPDIGTEVRGVFALKCAGCHGPDLERPKGRFGYVLDLRRVAANPEMVIPGKLAESELWMLVKHSEMPPPDSPRGPLSSAQKEIISKWIEAGAPDVVASAESSPLTIEEEVVRPNQTALDRSIGWIGKFHLLVVHFPIALVVAAGLAEMWAVWRKLPRPLESVRYCLWLAALAVVPTAALGWLLAASGNGAASPRLLLAHRWLGTAAAACLLITTFCAERDARRAIRSRVVTLLLVAAIIITSATAHLGGLLAWGTDFFSY